MTQSWDWKKNISEVVLNKTANPNTGTVPPQVVRGALYKGSANDPKVYMYGGTTSGLNTSSIYYKEPTAVQYALWSYDTSNGNWDQYDVTSAGGHRPNHGAWAEAPDLGMAFYYGGLLDNGSSLDTDVLKTRKQFLQSMQVLDLKTQTAKNVSTAAVSDGNGRIGGALQYIPGLGQKGMLTLIGGGEQSYQDSTGSNTSLNLVNGTMVRLHISFPKIPADHILGPHGYHKRS